MKFVLLFAACIILLAHPCSGDILKEKERVWFVRPLVGETYNAVASDDGWKCPDGKVLADPVIVVGTDGSGTRVVAKLLALLNTTVLVERNVYGQMDIDGRFAGVHFTSTIQRVLEATKSPDYRTEDVPLAARREATALAAKFAASLRANACAAGASASWALKKPDLMNLLPFLALEFPRMQVLHVVRDGRDMAFSHNHAPLAKFGVALGHAPPNKGDDLQSSERQQQNQQVLLWALQNLALKVWGERWNSARSSSVNNNNNGGTGGGSHIGGSGKGGGEDMSQDSSQAAGRYLWLRIEDFDAESSSGVSLVAAALAGIAASRHTTRAPRPECVALALRELAASSLGSHDPSARHSSREASSATGGGVVGGEAVRTRLGKWRSLASPERQTELTALARDALVAFGYLSPWAPGGGKVESTRSMSRSKNK